MVAVLLATVAFDKDLAPLCLASWLAKLLVMSDLLLFMSMLSSALFALRLRTCTRHSSTLALLHKELDRMRGDKRPWGEPAGILFVLGTGCLALLIAGLVLFA